MSYVSDCQQFFEPHRNQATAEPMKKYMRGQFEYLGIKTPRRRELLKEFWAEKGVVPIEELETAVLGLWMLPEREFQYIALALVDKHRRRLTPAHLPLLETLLTTKSWWDTVDGLAANQVGGLLRDYPEERPEWIGRWRRSPDFWLRRTALLFQLKYKERTDLDLLFALIRENIDSSEFFIQKAIGWVLREYSKTDPEAVLAFVQETPLASLSHREALKWMKNRGILS